MIQIVAGQNALENLNSIHWIVDSKSVGWPCVCVCALNKLYNKCIMWMKKMVCIAINEVKWRKLQNIINIYFAQFLMFWHPSDDSIYSVQRIYQCFDSNWETLRMSKKQFVGKKKEKHEIIYRNPNKLIRLC